MNVDSFVNEVVDMGVAGVRSSDLFTPGKDSDWYSLVVLAQAGQFCEIRSDVVTRNTVLVGMRLRVSSYFRSAGIEEDKDVFIELSYTNQRTKSLVELQFKCEETPSLKNIERFKCIQGYWYARGITGDRGEAISLENFISEQEIELDQIIAAMSRSLFM